MLRVVLLVLLHLLDAQDIGPRGNRRPPIPAVRRRDPLPLAKSRPAPTPQPDSGATYYQTGYQGYPSQQGQPTFQDGYREAQQVPTTFQGQTSAQQLVSQSTGTAQPSSGQTDPNAVTSGSTDATQTTPTDRAFFTTTGGVTTTVSSSTATGTSRTQATAVQSPSGQIVTQPSSSLFGQPQSNTAFVQPTQTTFPQSQSSQPSLVVQGQTLVQPAGATTTFTTQPGLQPVAQPAKSTSTTTSQSAFPTQPSTTTTSIPFSTLPLSSQPLSSSQTITGTAQLLPGQSQPITSQPVPNQPVSTQPLPAQPLPVQPLPAQSLPAQPLPAQPAAPTPLYVPYVPKDFDLRGCFTDTAWCPTTMSCVSTAFFNISCPNYREPVYLNSINLECSAEAQNMWLRLNYTASPPQPPYLSSWQDTTFRTILLDFISRVTNPALDSFVPREQRVATFDNDGTVWIEQPVLNQVAFLLWFVKRFPDPGQILQNQLAGYLDGTTRGDPMSAVLSGLSVDMYNDFIRIWAEETKHPTFNRPYPDLVFAPMIELMNLMQAACFNVYIVSGGENLFMRALLPRLYGIPPSNLVGSFMDLKYEQSSTPGTGMEFKIYPRTPVVVDKALKPVAIQRNVGRVPIFAFGNSDGDFEMLQYATAGPGVRLGCLLRHDDAAREVVYDGHLTRSIDAAPSNGWLFASMKKDFKEVFPFTRQPTNIIYMPRPRTAAPTPPPPTPLPTVTRALPYIRTAIPLPAVTAPSAMTSQLPVVTAQPPALPVVAVSLPPLAPINSSTIILVDPTTGLATVRPIVAVAPPPTPVR